MQLGEGARALRLLVIDDEDANLVVARRTLERAGYEHVVTLSDPGEAVDVFVASAPDLVLLDLHMPVVDGFEVMRRLASLGESVSPVPVLVLTGDTREEVKRNAFAAGARDFLTKPFSPTELVLRVRNLLEVQQLQRWLRDQNAMLEDQVSERTAELEQARLEVVDRLALTAEYRDDATQEHAWRIGRTSGRLADAMGMLGDEAELLGRAAPLHDIGKVGIPDSILLKPGSLTAEEFAAMKRHTTIGADILSGSRSSLLNLAEVIALTHHERWDGGGYPNRAKGDEIPLPGRIVAVADVFDALTHDRPYKPAWPLEEAIDAVLNERERQFDPEIVDVFATLDHTALLSRMGDYQGSSHLHADMSEPPPAGSCA